MPPGLWEIPPFLHWNVLIEVFFASVILFHWVLVFGGGLRWLGWRALQKRGWKIVDYIWLGAGTVALGGTAFQARQLLATGMVSQMRSMVSTSSDEAKFYSSPEFWNGLLCRKFVRSPLSPPEAEFNESQKEYDEACVWAKDISARVSPIDRWTVIDVASLPKTPPARQEPNIPKFEQQIFDAFKTHNEFARRWQALLIAQNRSSVEETLVIIAPVLAVLALALRVTKVTGEIRLR